MKKHMALAVLSLALGVVFAAAVAAQEVLPKPGDFNWEPYHEADDFSGERTRLAC